jgi:DNA gyrase subunit A
VGIAQVHANEELLVITEQGKILRTPASEIRTIGRATQGVRLMDLEGDDRIVSVALVESGDTNGNGPAPSEVEGNGETGSGGE